MVAIMTQYVMSKDSYKKTVQNAGSLLEVTEKTLQYVEAFAQLSAKDDGEAYMNAFLVLQTLADSVQEQSTKRLIEENNITTCDDAIVFFHECKAWPSLSAKPKSAWQALKRFEKENNCTLPMNAPFSFTFRESKANVTGTALKSAIYALYKICNAFEQRKYAAKAKLDKQARILKSAIIDCKAGKISKEELAVGIEKAKKAGLQGDIVKEAQALVAELSAKTVLIHTRGFNLHYSFVDLSCVYGEVQEKVQAFRLNDIRQSKQVTLPYKQARKKNNMFFYLDVEKALEKAGLKKNIFQKLQFAEKQLFDIAVEVKKAGPKTTKEDMMIILQSIREVLDRA